MVFSVHRKHLCCIIEMFLLNFWWWSAYKQNNLRLMGAFQGNWNIFSVKILFCPGHLRLHCPDIKTVETINCQHDKKKLCRYFNPKTKTDHCSRCNEKRIHFWPHWTIFDCHHMKLNKLSNCSPWDTLKGITI